MALVVYTGGARSGKSGAAQRLAESRALEGRSVTVAVFGRPSDDEMAERVRKHQQQRPDTFATLEVTEPTAWLASVPADDLLLVDCLGTFVGLAMESAWRSCAGGELDAAEKYRLPEQFEDTLTAIVNPAVDELLARRADTIIVTNETGLGVVPEWASARLFRDLLGLVNRRCVMASDAAYLCVCGRMISLHSLPEVVSWPQD